MKDTPLRWFAMPDGRPYFKAVLGGYPRQIVGDNREQLEVIASRMKVGLA